MEDYTHCQPALDLFRGLRQSYGHVGIVIQAYLYRSLQDVQDLAQLRPNLRLVKGAYKESDKVAFPKKSDVDAQFMRLIREQLKYGYTAIATHDRKIVDQVKALVKEQNIGRDKFEFQMLYGICEDLQDQLVREGFKVRVYVPYGEDWFGYFMRRLAERPANVWFVLKNMRK
jgi:proline dehydrogenase